jgi:CubicO group peptidase (beta-lactamase class C family)
MRAPIRTALRGLAASALALALLAGPNRPKAQEPSSDSPAADSPAAPRTLQSASQASALPPPPETSPPVPDQPAAEPQAAATSAARPPPPPRLAAGLPMPPAELEALVDGAVRQAMSDRHVPGVIVSVVQDGQLVLKKGYGVAALAPARPVDPDATLFRVGSISKLFTWTLVMKEVERGRMRLDAPVNLYLPEPLQIHDQGYQRPVLLRDLLNHSAGFEDRMLGRLFEREANRVRPLNTYLRQERPKRVRAQGELPIYSNYGAALAGAALQQVTGKSYDDLVEAEILRPLSLGHTTFREPYPADPNLPAPMPAALASNLSQGFAYTHGLFEAQPFEYISQLAPAGSASSTAADMATLMQLILAGGALNGQTIYGPQTASAFRTPSMRIGPGMAGFADGFWYRPLPGGFDSYGHEGQTLNFRTNLVTVPALGLGIFVSGNSDGAGDLVESLPALIVSRFYISPSLPAVEPSPDLYAERSAYVGDYLSLKRRYGGLEQFVALLTARIQVAVKRDGRLTVTGDGQDDVFVPDGQPGQFREIGGQRRLAGFQMAGGVAQRWLSPSGAGAYERVGSFKRKRMLGPIGLAALIASVATLVGLFTRDRREFRQTSIQGRASAIQTSTAGLWLVAIGGFGWWALRTLRDPSVAFYEWPGPWVLIASSAALVATLCSAGQVLLLPAIWKGGRRVDSWTAGRKLRFSLTSLIFLAFGVLLGLWGALEPWTA